MSIRTAALRAAQTAALCLPFYRCHQLALLTENGMDAPGLVVLPGVLEVWFWSYDCIGHGIGAVEVVRNLHGCEGSHMVRIGKLRFGVQVGGWCERMFRPRLNHAA